MRYPDPRDRRARRAEALSRPEIRTPLGGWVNVVSRLPDDGRHVRVKASDLGGPEYILPFDAVRRDGQWFNANHERPLQVRVIAWQYKIGG